MKEESKKKLNDLKAFSVQQHQHILSCKIFDIISNTQTHTPSERERVKKEEIMLIVSMRISKTTVWPTRKAKENEL